MDLQSFTSLYTLAGMDEALKQSVLETFGIMAVVIGVLFVILVILVPVCIFLMIDDMP